MIRIFDNDDKTHHPQTPTETDFQVQPILNKTSTSMNPSAHRELDGTNVHTSNTSQRREKKQQILKAKVVP